jgi:hypothetical protein
MPRRASAPPPSRRPARYGRTMRTFLPRCVIAAFVATATAAAVLGAAQAASTAPVELAITPAGVGGVKLGARYSTLHAAHLLGKVQRGCELAGPKARAAKLVAPLRGSVNLTDTTPRKVAAIDIRGVRATASGIGIGSTYAALKKAFPKATSDHSTESTFAVTLVNVPKGGGGRLQFAVSVMTKKVSEVGIPFIPTCD